MRYKHLTREQRYTIESLLQTPMNLREIGEVIGVRTGTVSREIAKELDAEFYFARPYHSWERGANENTNGLIRQYIPKGTDFSELTDEMLAEIEWKLNHRPRKSLGYRTPLEYCKQLFKFDF